MPDEAILVFDVGTTNFKAIVYDLDGEDLAFFNTPFRPAYDSEGMVFQNPLDWRDAVVDGAGKAMDFARRNKRAIIAVSLTASRSSVIPVDENGDHIEPAMMWQETASRSIVNELNQGETLERIYRLSGSRPNTVFSAPKMAWLRRHRPEVYERAHKLVGIQDYLINFLTGEFVTDHTFGSRTLLMYIRDRRWNDELLRIFGVDGEKLCRLIPTCSVAGTVNARAAKATGLPKDLPVVTAGGDQQNAALGAGVLNPGDVMVNMGTGSFLVAEVANPISDPGMRVMCNASAVPDKWILDAGMLATGSVHRWFVENFYNEFPAQDLDRRYAQAEREAAGSTIGSNGLFVLPHFSGCGAPYWENRAKGAFYGLTLGHRRQDLARAVLEGIAGEIAHNLEVADELIGGIRHCHLAGGLSRSVFFNQLLADVCQRPLTLSRTREATARGAWGQAMVALGRAGSHAEALARGVGGTRVVITPNASLARFYRWFADQRQRLYQCLSVMHQEQE